MEAEGRDYHAHAEEAAERHLLVGGERDAIGIIHNEVLFYIMNKLI